MLRSPKGTYYRALRRMERRSRWAVATHGERDMELLRQACALVNRIAIAYEVR